MVTEFQFRPAISLESARTIVAQDRERLHFRNSRIAPLSALSRPAMLCGQRARTGHALFATVAKLVIATNAAGSVPVEVDVDLRALAVVAHVREKADLVVFARLIPANPAFHVLAIRVLGPLAILVLGPSKAPLEAACPITSWSAIESDAKLQLWISTKW